MAKKKFPITPIGVAYVCDKCGKGLVIATEEAPNSDGVFRHFCNLCHHEYFFEEKFPTIKWQFPPISTVTNPQEVQNEEVQKVSQCEQGTKDELCEVSDHGCSPITGHLIKGEVSPD